MRGSLMQDCIDHGQKGNSGGYGHAKRDNRTVYAHRKAYADYHKLDVFKLPGVVRHTCDNPRCINPTHLVIGTHKDNSADMVGRGRCKAPPGEHHGNSRLTKEQVNMIRERYIPRSMTHGARALGRELGISEATIRDAP